MGDLGTEPKTRPFAKRARELCPESDEHHDEVWFCTTCRLLEQRLTPIHMMPAFQALLEEADLTIQ